mmetsp:Transcript_44428/g.172600  ORF Transcript_44428/g.172600 Transcript_44428/m.172600 type:complete len:337 (-) Transcript_44428:244-1254(-)|eukprot:CAMPEP_0113965004 /NCGR_PEP_ID=MMETSP0011_2-20120614/7497_1 /TAXON_ID=101924 /ORGANISM="Rhodosorus marinus" /LENGTH=336 /DNA_ID=CAMNT_0000977455 /DNA_START=148 /DNA_END=1158 /DNA_ORIENTATION=- /assembly_acc=CAM_ASM_000156
MSVPCFVGVSAPLATPAGRRSVIRSGRGEQGVCVRQGVSMQVWSDQRPRLEYFEYLEKGAKKLEDDQKSIIVGDGRIGNLLYELGGEKDIMVRRGDTIPDEPGPVYLCTRNDSLGEIIENCPENKKDDLVFIQNGYIEPVLQKYSLAEDVTKANIYFAVTEKGAAPIDGVTEECPDGMTTATGRWSEAFRQRLNKAKTPLKCIVQNKRDYRRSMYDKLIWISAFNLIGSVHGNITMGDVAKRHKKEVKEMVNEMRHMCRASLAVVLFPKLEERLLQYASKVDFFPTAIKEFKWRNGYFYNFSLIARENGFDDPTPMHTAYLLEGKEMGLIDWVHER